MAGDTRESSPTPRGPRHPEAESPEHVRKPAKNYELFNSPPASANALPPGSGLNTAGSKFNPTLGDALQTIRLQDFSQVHMYPCVRESLLMGIGAGFGVGGVRAMLGGLTPKAANWAVGSFVLISMANYEYCLYKRQREKANMKRVVEIMELRRVEKKEAERVKAEEMQKAKEFADRKAEEQKKNRWKFW